MAYDEILAERVRTKISDKSGYDEKKMFGGVCFLIHGNMACGILNQDVIVRVGKDGYKEALEAPHTKEFDITGKTMTGWVMVSPPGHESDQQLEDWLQKGIQFASSLPKK